jgi:asparagine synthase (glutamine-hydrolysing)
MKDRIIHRGPDDEGSYFDDLVALGFRRLSIIDLEGGHQPMANEDGSIVVTLNGAIYNYLDLRSELAEKGHVFSTKSDSEVLVHGWEEYGEGLLDKLRGMFAFVIWDARSQAAFGARDFFGAKPFYYTWQDGNFVYASEIKSILDYPGIKPELNLEALEQYLSLQYSVLPETFFKGIFKLGPGECFTLKDGALSTRCYFDPLPQAQSVDSIPSDDPFAFTVEKIKQVVAESVQAHMIADVEVASLLSGGIDSSYVTALYPNERTYTTGFETADGVKYNEISYAKQAAEEMGKKNTSRVITPEEYWDAVPLVMYHMDEPLADPSAVALFFLDELVARDVKVVFSGEGADEFFGGYPIYHEPLSLAGFQKLPRGLRRALAAVARAIPFYFKGKSFLDRASKTVEERYVSNAYLFSVAEREVLLKSPVYAPPPESLTQPYYAKVAYSDDTGKMQYIDYNFWQPGDILLKGDKMSMAHSLEARTPFLDLKVFALTNTLPLEYRVNDETTKVALRAAAREVLPERIAQRPKLGFPVPMRVWLKEDRWYGRVREAFESESAQRFFKVEPLVKLLDDHRNGKADNSRKIWNVYVFLVWYNVFFAN